MRYKWQNAGYYYHSVFFLLVENLPYARIYIKLFNSRACVSPQNNRPFSLLTLISFLFLRRYPDGTVKLRNPNIELMDQDILYHLALGSGSHDLVEMFGDVKVN